MPEWKDMTMQGHLKHRICFLSLLWFFLPSAISPSWARIYLVSVGISDYPGESNDLRLPANDARTISWLYSKNDDVQRRELINEKATITNILSCMNLLYAKAKKTDIIVFFFSGHGYPGGFFAYDGGLTYEQIRKAMARGHCVNKMIFADACYSGKFASESGGGKQSLNAAKKASVMLFLSSRATETSIERLSMQNGFFTTYLQKGLRGGADKDKNRIITARELYEYVHSGVVEISGNRQHPVMWGNFSHQMPVMKW